MPYIRPGPYREWLTTIGKHVPHIPGSDAYEAMSAMWDELVTRQSSFFNEAIEWTERQDETLRGILHRLADKNTHTVPRRAVQARTANLQCFRHDDKAALNFTNCINRLIAAGEIEIANEKPIAYRLLTKAQPDA